LIARCARHPFGAHSVRLSAREASLGANSRPPGSQHKVTVPLILCSDNALLTVRAPKSPTDTRIYLARQPSPGAII